MLLLIYSSLKLGAHVLKALKYASIHMIIQKLDTSSVKLLIINAPQRNDLTNVMSADIDTGPFVGI